MTTFNSLFPFPLVDFLTSSKQITLVCSTLSLSALNFLHIIFSSIYIIYYFSLHMISHILREIVIKQHMEKHYKIMNLEKWCKEKKFLIVIQKVKVAQSCLTGAHGLYSPWNSPGQNHWSGQPFPSPGVFPIQGWNPGLPHCRKILYQLSHKGSP